MKVENAIVLVTGANRGLDIALAREALQRGAKKVYAGARDPSSISLAGHGGGAIINLLSVASWISSPLLSVYGSTKSAAWGLTNGLRRELLTQKTQVLGLHVGFIDTDLVRGLDVEKIAPELVAQRTLDGLEAGAEEVLADEKTRMVKGGLSAERGIYLQNVGG